MFLIAYDLTIQVTCYCECDNEIDEIVDVLIKRDENGKLTEDSNDE